MDVGLLIQGATVLVTAGAAFGGVKVALNGTRERVRNVESAAHEHELRDYTRHIEVVGRLATIEAKIDGRTISAPREGVSQGA